MAWSKGALGIKKQVDYTHLLIWYSREVTKMDEQKQAKKQAAGIQLPAAQFKKVGWWDSPSSLPNLQWDRFLPPEGLRGSWDIQNTHRRELWPYPRPYKVVPSDLVGHIM